MAAEAEAQQSRDQIVVTIAEKDPLRPRSAHYLSLPTAIISSVPELFSYPFAVMQAGNSIPG